MRMHFALLFDQNSVIFKTGSNGTSLFDFQPMRRNDEGLPGVLGNKGTSPFTFREQGIFQNNF